MISSGVHREYCHSFIVEGHANVAVLKILLNFAGIALRVFA